MWWILVDSNGLYFRLASKKKNGTRKEYCLRLIRAIWKKWEAVFVVFSLNKESRLGKIIM